MRGHNNTIRGAFEAIILSDLRPATVFSSFRLRMVILFYLTISTALAVTLTGVSLIDFSPPPSPPPASSVASPPPATTVSSDGGGGSRAGGATSAPTCAEDGPAEDADADAATGVVTGEVAGFDGADGAAPNGAAPCSESTMLLLLLRPASSSR